jgi:hypothetical protein
VRWRIRDAPDFVDALGKRVWCPKWLSSMTISRRSPFGCDGSFRRLVTNH